MMYLITLVTSFSTKFLPWKNNIEFCFKVCDWEQCTITVRSVACAIFIFLPRSTPSKNSTKIYVMIYEYIYECSRKIWIRNYVRNFKSIRPGANFVCLPCYALYDSCVLTTGELHFTRALRLKSLLKVLKTPHLNSAHKIDFDPVGMTFYIIFLRGVTHCAVSRCAWRTYYCGKKLRWILL